MLDIGTGPYRPPDALLGNKSYSTPLDIWSLGVLLSELASTSPTPTPIFTSPPTHEDGSQLGLILSIFRTLGTPTPETWPEALKFRTSPFAMWRVFEGAGDAFDGIRGEFRGLVRGMLRFESGERVTAKQVRCELDGTFIYLPSMVFLMPMLTRKQRPSNTSASKTKNKIQDPFPLPLPLSLPLSSSHKTDNTKAQSPPHLPRFSDPR
ncbi:hypothetical protein IMZ48_13855 [Candidatus Bathyarchaeota archaeon]|nr:hypothetical protein [Candidatus Bathyarchaeota archaeon]